MVEMFGHIEDTRLVVLDSDFLDFLLNSSTPSLYNKYDYSHLNFSISNSITSIPATPIQLMPSLNPQSTGIHHLSSYLLPL